MYKNKTIFVTVLFLLVLFSTFLHFYQIGSIPNGFFCDESAIGYNAFSILETGKDEYGSSYPVFFRCFDNYHEPVMVYSLAPLIKLFGLVKPVVRFISGFYMMVASFVFFFLAYHYTRNRWISLVGAFLFSILPWAFPVSRTTMSGYTPMLLGINLGWLFLMKAFARKSKVYALIAGLGWSLAMYSHNCGRPMSALLLICFFAALNKGTIKRWKIFIWFSTSFIIFLIPMILYVLNNPNSMTERFNTISVWQDNSVFINIVLKIFIRYLEYFSPNFLFITGDPVLRHNPGNSGVLFVFMTPFIIMGFYAVIKYFKKNFYYRFAFLGILIYPVAGILTIDHYHSTRTLNGMPFWCILFLIGLQISFREIKPFLIADKRDVEKKIIVKPKYNILLFIIVILLAIVEIPLYFEDYFNKDKYVSRSRLAFETPAVEALEMAFKNLKPDETLYLSAFHYTDEDFKPFLYSHLLFFGMIPPEVYQEKGIPDYIVSKYSKPISGKGVLLKASHLLRRDKKRGFFWEKNVEPIPINHKLIGKILLKAEPEVYYEIYKINPK